MRSFPGHFILQAEQPQFSQLFSLWGSFVLLILGSTSGLASSGPCISCAEGSSIRHSTVDGISPEESRAEQSRGEESPPSTCCPLCWWCSPGRLSGLLVHLAGSCSVFYPPAHPRTSVQGCSQSLPPPACVYTRGLNQVQALSCSSHGSTPRGSPGPS